MTEDRYRSRIDDYVDASLGEAERRTFESHLETCDSCRSLVDDLLRIRSMAQTLTRVSPPEALWKRLAFFIRSERTTAEKGNHRWLRSWSGFWRARWLMAAAAVVVIGIALGSAFLWTGTDGSGDDSEELSRWVAAELRLAEQHYQNAIGGLEKIVEKDEDALDPEVMAVLQENLDVIERAIGESRAAAREHPANPAAGESLLAALRRKLTLLQNTVLLINEVRKGEAETARELLDQIRDAESRSTNPKS